MRIRIVDENKQKLCLSSLRGLALQGVKGHSHQVLFFVDFKDHFIALIIAIITIINIIIVLSSALLLSLLHFYFIINVITISQLFLSPL